MVIQIGLIEDSVAYINRGTFLFDIFKLLKKVQVVFLDLGFPFYRQVGEWLVIKAILVLIEKAVAHLIKRVRDLPFLLKKKVLLFCSFCFFNVSSARL